jgi:5'-nucleotidase
VKRALLTLGLVSLLVVVVVGCAKKASDATAAADVPQNESVVDVSAQPMPTQQPQPVAEQPVVYDDAMTTPQAPAAFAEGMAAGTYTVKKGDTLYSIARQRYGDGKQWTRIADANPGLDPTKIKVGQTLNIP